MTLRKTLPLIALALAACGAQPAPAPADNGIDTAAPTAETNETTAPPTEPAPTNEVESAALTIPEALRGRWGLVPADCTSTRGDAKGLLEISETTLSFYESRATLTAIVEQDPTRLVGDFAFTGEGQTWQRREVLDGQDDGQTLIRREQGADAMPGVLRYRKCEAA